MRACPVKAIGIEKGQAHVLEDKCVLCGRCVVECPQKAKQVEDQVSDVKKAIRANRRVILSMAPSFVAAFPEFSPAQLWDKLLGLGFSAVEETAVGAEVVSRVYSQLLQSAHEPVISACCPVIVNAVKKYYPQLVKNLASVMSPMQVHARLIKERFGKDTMVVFAGPCIAKIREKDETCSQVEVVITFEQLKCWLAEPDNRYYIDKSLQTLKASGGARHYPIAGGILKSFTRSEYTAADIIAVDGLDKCLTVFDALNRGEIAPKFVEALACSGGCIDGPACGTDKCSPAKRVKILEFAAARDSAELQAKQDTGAFYREHIADPVNDSLPSEDQIRQVLQQTGKFTERDEKNCGACGFNSCREKAIAVCQGLTTIDTCVPYMRSKAESLANIIVDNSLNAIIVVNRSLEIQDFNPAAEKMFGQRKELVKGQLLTELMECSSITVAAESGEKITGRRVKVAVSGVVAEQKVIPVDEHNLIIVVMTDITAQERHLRELEEMKNQTVEKASEIIDKQMQVAQEIAGLLGETTAETKAALLELMGLLKAGR
jgi:PAS domain S-box-containing protein